jgi:hypothetical protein
MVFCPSIPPIFCLLSRLDGVSPTGGSPSARGKSRELRLEAGPLLERPAAPSLRKGSIRSHRSLGARVPWKCVWRHRVNGGWWESTPEICPRVSWAAIKPVVPGPNGELHNQLAAPVNDWIRWIVLCALSQKSLTACLKSTPQCQISPSCVFEQRLNSHEDDVRERGRIRSRQRAPVRRHGNLSYSLPHEIALDILPRFCIPP